MVSATAAVTAAVMVLAVVLAVVLVLVLVVVVEVLLLLAAVVAVLVLVLVVMVLVLVLVLIVMAMAMVAMPTHTSPLMMHLFSVPYGHTYTRGVEHGYIYCSAESVAGAHGYHVASDVVSVHRVADVGQAGSRTEADAVHGVHRWAGCPYRGGVRRQTH